MSNIQHIIDRFESATTFIEVFGFVSDKKTLRRSFIKLAMIVHPDRTSVKEKEEANKAIQLLTKLRVLAERALEAGTYKQPFTPLKITMTEIISATESYFVPNVPRWVGDYSCIYVSTCKSTGMQVLIKIAKSPAQNGVLEHEERTIRRLASKKVPYIIEPIDSFLIDDHPRRLRASVYPYDPGYMSLREIRNRIDKPLDPRDAAWMWRRVAGQVLAAKQARLIHGAINPDHVLVHPVTHDVKHIGWTQAVRPGNCIPYNKDDDDDTITAPEIVEGKPVDQATDVFMASATMLFLVDNYMDKLPDPIVKVLVEATTRDPGYRPYTGRRLLDRLTTEIRKEWGRSYRQLDLP